MAGKRDKPEDIVLKLRQIEVLHGQGMAISDAVRQIGVTEPTYYRWRKQYGGMNRDQLKRLKELERENQRLRRAVSDQTSNKKRRPLGRRSVFPHTRGLRLSYGDAKASGHQNHQAAANPKQAAGSEQYHPPALRSDQGHHQLRCCRL